MTNDYYGYMRIGISTVGCCVVCSAVGWKPRGASYGWLRGGVRRGWLEAPWWVARLVAFWCAVRLAGSPVGCRTIGCFQVRGTVG